MPDQTSNGWIEYRRLVLSELERLNEGQEETRDEVRAIRTDIATLKVKSGLWGAAAGVIPAAIAIVWMLVR